ncbi:MAG: MlaD family protein [Pseudomonadota bacterium]
METRANHIVIGIFALAVMIAAMAFIYWVAEVGGEDNSAEVIFEFNGPINGLATGSPVLFNGVPVGDVREVDFDPDDPGKALARAFIEADTPVRSDTTATLGLTGITGTAFVGLRGGSLDAPSVLSTEEAVVITADPSAVQDLVDGARTFLARADNAMGTVEDFLLTNEPVLSATIADVNAITSTIADQSDSIEQLMQGVGAIATEISGLSGRLEGIIAGSETLIAAVEPGDVRQIVQNVRDASADLRGIGAQAETLIARGDVVFDNLETSSQTLVTTLDEARGLVEAIDEEQIGQIVSDVAAFSSQLPQTGGRIDGVLANAEQAADSIATFTQSLEDNTPQVDAIFEDAAIIADRLEVASRRIDGLLASVDGVLGEEETQGLIADARDAARALRNVAVAFEGRSDAIADGLARFTGSGLRDAEALIGDGRRVLNRLERLVLSVERNPQQFVFGGERAPEYAPQRR